MNKTVHPRMHEYEKNLKVETSFLEEYGPYMHLQRAARVLDENIAELRMKIVEIEGVINSLQLQRDMMSHYTRWLEDNTKYILKLVRRIEELEKSNAK